MYVKGRVFVLVFNFFSGLYFCLICIYRNDFIFENNALFVLVYINVELREGRRSEVRNEGI